MGAGPSLLDLAPAQRIAECTRRLERLESPWRISHMNLDNITRRVLRAHILRATAEMNRADAA